MWGYHFYTRSYYYGGEHGSPPSEIRLPQSENCLQVDLCLPQNGSCPPIRPRDFPVVYQASPQASPVPFLQKPFVCVCGGVVEVSVWGGSGHLREVVVAPVTLLLSDDLGKDRSLPGYLALAVTRPPKSLAQLRQGQNNRS